MPAEAAEALADALTAEAEVKPIGLGARDPLRLEAGLPLYGHDLDPETTPVMADLGFALSKRRREEGNFMGAERILLEREQGPVVKRVGLVVEGRQPVPRGRCGGRCGRVRCRQGHQRRLRAELRRADRDGLCACRDERRWAPSSS